MGRGTSWIKRWGPERGGSEPPLRTMKYIYVYTYLHFELRFLRFHIESWPKLGLSLQTCAYRACALTTECLQDQVTAKLKSSLYDISIYISIYIYIVLCVIFMFYLHVLYRIIYICKYCIIYI